MQLFTEENLIRAAQLEVAIPIVTVTVHIKLCYVLYCIRLLSVYLQNMVTVFNLLLQCYLLKIVHNNIG